MSVQRKRYSAETKAKVVLGAINPKLRLSLPGTPEQKYPYLLRV